MNEFDLSKAGNGPAAGNPLYDPDLALEFFKLAGKPENVARGTTIFSENQKGNRLLLRREKMYLLLEGDVSLVVKGKTIGTVQEGEIFGEMATISQLPRSATAVAETDCRLVTLDDKQFQSALPKMPDFALMLMSVMIGRLRETIARLVADNALAGEKWNQSTVFDEESRTALVKALGEDSLMRFDQNKIIMKEGQTGVLMYVVLEGRVTVVIQDKIVEKVGPGGVFGEMALVDRTPRLAGAYAETNCTVLAINRNTFLKLVKTSRRFGSALLGVVGERAVSMTSRS